VEFEHCGKVWKTWAPAKCCYFVWLVANNKCWTADRLSKRGMDHPEKYPLSDQEEESIDHLLLSCVFPMQFWFSLFQLLDQQEFTPQIDTISFMNWWQMVNDLRLGPRRKCLNSMIILGAWILWKHRNKCVFDGVAPSLVAALSLANDERSAWKMAGAKRISFLMAQGAQGLV
jgi:hypothetical protein